MKAILSALVWILSVAASVSAFAGSGEQCHDLFMSPDMYRAEITEQLKVKLRAQTFNPEKGLLEWKGLADVDAKFAKLFPETDVLRIFATEEMPYFERNLEHIMHQLTRKLAIDGLQPSVALPDVLREMLHNKVPARTLEQRVSGFLKGRVEIERILGDNSFAETQELFYGSSPLKPTPDSLIGQYLARTGASSVVRTFNKEPGKVQNKGPQSQPRLAVAVDAKTFPIWAELFNREDMLSVFGHAQVVQNGKIVSYNQKFGDLRAMSAGHILPAVLMKTTVAQRMEFFMNIIANTEIPWGWKNEPFVPWLAKDYCSVIGGFETCTHWIGNAPVGDVRVGAYSFPGAVDSYAQNQLVPGVVEKDKANPRIARLAPHGRAFKDGRLNKLYQAPGYEQFSSVIGQIDANTRGEFANPGWLIQTLIGPTDVSFVPFVFTFQADAAAPLDPAFVPTFEDPL